MYRLFLSLMFTCVAVMAHATPASDLSALLNNMKSMKADFTQTIYDNRGVAIQTSYGKMALQRPGRFRWQVTKPIPQLIIASNDKLWIYDPDLEQVTVRSLKQGAGETPALFLSHENTVVENDFNVKLEKEDAAGWRWYKLIPKKPDNMFESIQMGFKQNQIEEMKLADNLGHTTRIQYQKIQSNTALAPSLFEFHAPANVDVIDETRKQ